MSCTNKYKDTSLYTKFMEGGLGYGSLCVPNIILDLILIIIFPPIYVISYQVQTKKMNMTQIIVNFILTSLFYFPGFIHALSVMRNKDKCGSIFEDKNKI